MKNWLLILLIPLLLISCTGASHFTRKGDKSQAAGRPGEASFQYIQALRRKPGHIKAIAGLQVSGQEQLNRLLDNFFAFHNEDKLKEGLYAFKEADGFYQEVSSVKVDLRFPGYYREYFEEDKTQFLSETYETGMKAFQNREYKSAENLFDEIKKWDPNYKDVSQLRNQAEIIPLYEEALLDYDNEFYKTAHRKFQRIISLDPRYKEAGLYLSESLKRGTFTIAFTPFEQIVAVPSLAQTLNAQVLAELSKSKNPFLQIVDRSNLQQILTEQKIALTNSTDYVKVGEIIGAKALLIGKILEYQYTGGKVTGTARTGYEAFQDSAKNSQTGLMEAVTRYKKVYYQEYQGKSVIHCKVQYQLISTRDGSILASDVFTKDLQDQVNYIEYPGNINMLVPGTWQQLKFNQANDRVLDTPQNRNEIKRLASARRDLKVENQLRSETVQELGQKVSRGILEYEATLK